MNLRASLVGPGKMKPRVRCVLRPIVCPPMVYCIPISCVLYVIDWQWQWIRVAVHRFSKNVGGVPKKNIPGARIMRCRKFHTEKPINIRRWCAELITWVGKCPRFLFPKRAFHSDVKLCVKMAEMGDGVDRGERWEQEKVSGSREIGRETMGDKVRIKLLAPELLFF